MSDAPLYLKPSVQMEPLFNSWYAWGMLVSPATSAMITANLHVRVLESYLQFPDLHRRAVADQAMKGGMFMDYDGDIAPVQALLDRTREHLAGKLAFAAAVKQLNELLATKTDGQSLAGLYESVPQPLKGYVELVYDLHNRPGFRLVEGMLYDSPNYDESLQSVRFSDIACDDRPFVLSSPRFASADDVDLHLPFRSPLVDALAALRTRPTSRGQVVQWLVEAGANEAQQQRFLSLLTDVAPPLDPQRHYSGDGIRVRYFGHATVLVQYAGLSILIDPAVSTASETGLDRYSFYDLPDAIDYVLLTHNHQDHVMLETLLQLRHKIGCVVVPRSASGPLQDPSLRLMLRTIGFANVIELDEFETLTAGAGEIIGLPFFGEHADLDIRSKLAYGIRSAGRGLVFLADSNALEPRCYAHIRRRVGDVDALFIGLECDGAPLSWLYGPLYTRPVQRAVDQSRRLNSSHSESAMQIIDRLAPEAVYVYAMGLEPWLGYISSISYSDDSRPIVESDRVLEQCRARQLPAERLYLKKEFVLSTVVREEI
ncbi:MBL fold metallo-hydrolase [Tahibacter amnicola]|uniref:MBL fold metallo-hydrolase n=1 Tax=Tahibacter amnicola TaxID=2976241 RepID=A0ABY6B847_9GAMM|nr:MBL fold metallo-hydrolase [Tahibacter amnicola]UXI66263.1 MBL fold metallo-hydrolase [Tahibacter amnicola]